MEEININQKKFVNIICPVLIFTLFAFSYWTVLYKMAIRWSTGDNNYCYLVAPIFAYLLWDRRRCFSFATLSWDFWGLVPILLSIGLIIIGEVGSVESMLYLGIWSCLTGIAHLLYGRRIRQLIFPFIILIFITPLPPFINNILTFRLKMAASSLSVNMLRASGISVFQEGNVIDLGITQLQVVDACSGLRYLMPLLLLALLVGYFFSQGLWRRSVLVLLAIPISVVLNAFRVYVTGLLHIAGKAALAENLFHDFTGWLIFMIAGALLYLISLGLKRLGKYQDQGGDQAKDPGGKPAGLRRPVILTSVICLLFVTSGWALREIPSVRNLPQRTAFKSFPMEIGQWQGKRNYLDKEILERLWADDYLSAVYTNPYSRNAIYMFIPFYEYQGTRHTAHAPQACLLGGGYALLNQQKRPVNLQNGNRVNVMTMVLVKGDIKVLGSYFFLQRGRVLTSPWVNKFYLMWDAFTKRRTDGALVRVEMVMYPNQSMEDAYVILEDFIGRLWELLPNYVPG